MRGASAHDRSDYSPCDADWSGNRVVFYAIGSEHVAGDLFKIRERTDRDRSRVDLQRMWVEPKRPLAENHGQCERDLAFAGRSLQPILSWVRRQRRRHLGQGSATSPRSVFARVRTGPSTRRPPQPCSGPHASGLRRSRLGMVGLLGPQSRNDERMLHDLNQSIGARP